ncbi:hypothetical protein BHE74_00045087 [Ensete ventricosum]|nr:hypothetical protein BHE74_00045087 [Ensete ventricosum]RZS05039.1 hypothetical protein BHM03_00035468 [Ensete ventricosum]
MVPLGCRVAPLATWALLLAPKTIIEFYVEAEESVAWFRRVRKLVKFGREEVRKPKKGPSGLRCASWDVRLRMELLGGSHEVLHKSLIGMEDTRYDPSNDQVSDMVF